MCFSVNVNLVREDLESRYGATLIDHDNYRPSYYYHAFSIPELPVICSDDPSKIRLFKWGLIPAGTINKEDAANIRMKTFNARAESINNKRSFASSFKTRRCIVPVKGFFEWQHSGKDKIPWYIYHPDNDIMSIAGLFDTWISNETGEILNTFTLITTEANELLARIHNSAKRMPVILENENEKLWLDMSQSEQSLLQVLKPYSYDLKAHTISPLVNSKTEDKNTPEVIKQYNVPLQNTLF